MVEVSCLPIWTFNDFHLLELLGFEGKAALAPAVARRAIARGLALQLKPGELVEAQRILKELEKENHGDRDTFRIESENNRLHHNPTDVAKMYLWFTPRGDSREWQ